MKLKVTRAFLTGGVIQEVGNQIDVPERQARELIALGKAEAAQELPPQTGPMTTDTTAELVKGKAKEKPHVGK